MKLNLGSKDIVLNAQKFDVRLSLRSTEMIEIINFSFGTLGEL